MLPIIFLGPSLGVNKARKIFSLADYRPPARKGDLLRIANEVGQNSSPAFVGLIDGVFLQDYPPTPMEVYALLQRKNVVLAGAASLGALRAVELEKFGMTGIGKIFNLYKSGKLGSDDEVAVTFSEQDYQLQSEAMIDIRYTLYFAAKAGVISKAAKNALLMVAKQTYFPRRNYDEIIEKSLAIGSMHSDEAAKLREYLSTNRRSLKEADGIKLVEFMKEMYYKSLRNAEQGKLSK